MCGPLPCMPCEEGFTDKICSNRISNRTSQVWFVLWVPLVLFWILYFGISVDRLFDTSEGTSFLTRIKSEPFIASPSWTFCTPSNQTSFLFISCFFDGNEPIISQKFSPTCWGSAPSSNHKVSPGKGETKCELVLSDNAESVRLFVHSEAIFKRLEKMPGVDIDVVMDLLTRIPSGLSFTDIKAKTDKTLFWSKKILRYLDDDQDSYHTFPSVATSESALPEGGNITMARIKAGDYSVWEYEEVEWDSGFDLWYFMGLLGGLSFLLLMIHSCGYLPLKRFWDAMEHRSYRDFDSTQSSGQLGGSGRPLQRVNPEQFDVRPDEELPNEDTHPSRVGPSYGSL